MSAPGDDGRPPLRRREAVARLLAGRDRTLVVSGLGASTYDVAAAGDHERNFYLWGAMGGASLIGLGLALAQPAVPVLVITGDGEMLMGLGGLATIGWQSAPNLTVVVLDNGVYGETGGQPSHTAGPTDLCAVAAACGIRETRRVATLPGVDDLARRSHAVGTGTLFAVVPVDPVEDARVLPSRDGVAIKARMRAALGLDSM